MKAASDNVCKCTRLYFIHSISNYWAFIHVLGTLWYNRQQQRRPLPLRKDFVANQGHSNKESSNCQLPLTLRLSVQGNFFYLGWKNGLGAQYNFNCTDYQLNTIQSKRIWWCWYVFPDEMQFCNSEAILPNLHFIKTQMNWQVNNLLLAISKIYYYW